MAAFGSSKGRCGDEQDLGENPQSLDSEVGCLDGTMIRLVCGLVAAAGRPFPALLCCV